MFYIKTGAVGSQATNTVQEQFEADTKTEEEIPVEADLTHDESDEAEPDKGEVQVEPAQAQEEAEAASGQDDTVETDLEKKTND